MARSAQYSAAWNFIPGDTIFFQLHYRVTCGALLACGVINCFIYFFGEPLSCTSLHSDVPPQMNNFCWLQLTSGDSDVFRDSRDAKHSQNYLWFPFFIFLQAVLVYFPHVVHKVVSRSDQKANFLVSRLNDVSQLKEEERKEELITNARFFIESLGKGLLLAWLLNICHLLNFGLAVTNLIITAHYFGFSVPEFQARVDGYLWGDSRNFLNPMAEVFPRTKNCDFNMTAADGTRVERTSVCRLTLNIFNEKAYIVLWIWFVFLVCAQALGLLIRAAWVFLPWWRRASLKTRLVMAGGKDAVSDVSEVCDFGDCSLLYHVGREADPLVFGKFVEAVAEEVRSRPADLERVGGNCGGHEMKNLPAAQ